MKPSSSSIVFFAGANIETEEQLEDIGNTFETEEQLEEIICTFEENLSSGHNESHIPKKNIEKDLQPNTSSYIKP